MLHELTSQSGYPHPKLVIQPELWRTGAQAQVLFSSGPQRRLPLRSAKGPQEAWHVRAKLAAVAANASMVLFKVFVCACGNGVGAFVHSTTCMGH